jgi:hypothetical protein
MMPLKIRWLKLYQAIAFRGGMHSYFKIYEEGDPDKKRSELFKDLSMYLVGDRIYVCDNNDESPIFKIIFTTNVAELEPVMEERFRNHLDNISAELVKHVVKKPTQ